jgi:gas vesicle protein
MKLILEIQNSLNLFKDNNAFCINGIFYKYKELEETVSKIRKSIRENIEENEDGGKEKIIEKQTEIRERNRGRGRREK